jgi:DNA-binding winged helix-turn-helix (wHTH) protein/hemoglobin-like flavoprotein
MGARTALTVRIEGLELDERRRELRRGRAALPVQPKVLDVLLHLVRERDRVVSRDELLAAVWPGVAVAPDSITRAIREVRRLLGDDARAQRVVRTYPGRGFRFVAPVRETTGEPAPAAGREATLASIDAAIARASADLPAIRVVVLGALDAAALERLAAAVLGRPTSPAGLAKLARLTGGHPRLAWHVLHLVKRLDRPLETLDALPARGAEGLRELVFEHVAVLGDDARRVLEAVSIVDLPFSADLAAELAATDVPAAADAIAAAHALGLFAAAPGARWRFAHELVRTVIAAAIAPARRAALHARAAVALERRHGTPRAELDRLVHHYVAGAPAGNAARALELVRRAADLALRDQAFEAAARHLTAGLDVEALLPAEPRRRRELWLELGKALARAGHVERAADAFAAADDAGDAGEVHALRAAFVAIAPDLPRIVERFYELLFARHPELRRLFTRAAPSLQRRMFGEAIAALADHAGEPAWLAGHLAALGRRHAEYGVTDEMYGWARAAFLDALGQPSAEVRASWARIFDRMAEQMIAAAHAALAASGLRPPDERPRASAR